MGLSALMREHLEEYVRTPPSRPDTAEVRWGGTWCCPLDGARMVSEDERRYRCPACDRYLTAWILGNLIELHPHRRERPASR